MNDKVEFCSCNVIHQDIIDNVKKNILSEDILFDLAELFKVLGDSTRVRILSLLLISEMCVCDISTALSMTQSAISHQLRVLKTSKLVKYRKEGKVVYYSLDDEHVKDIFNFGLAHVNEN